MVCICRRAREVAHAKYYTAKNTANAQAPGCQKNYFKQHRRYAIHVKHKNTIRVYFAKRAVVVISSCVVLCLLNAKSAQESSA